MSGVTDPRPELGLGDLRVQESGGGGGGSPERSTLIKGSIYIQPSGAQMFNVPFFKNKGPYPLSVRN